MGRMVMSEDSGSGEREALGNCGDYGTRKRQLTCKPCGNTEDRSACPDCDYLLKTGVDANREKSKGPGCLACSCGCLSMDLGGYTSYHSKTEMRVGPKNEMDQFPSIFFPREFSI